MANIAFLLEIVTPDGLVVTGKAVYVEAPGEDGRLGVLGGHQPGIIGLSAGRVTARFDGTGDTSWNTGAGVMTVTPDAVSILVQSAQASGPPNSSFSLDG
jgi:F0F1-type ATP synthase epsilon subunit